MKRIIIGILAAAAALLPATAAGQAAGRPELFPYPTPPEGLTLLRERCNFLVYHFWDRADMKKVFDRPEGLQAAFGDWVSFMPYCAADTAKIAIRNLLQTVGKDGKKLAKVAELAEYWTDGDSAEIVSEELFAPFAAAAATNKKVPEATRRHFARQLHRINSSAMGQMVPALPYTAPDGTERVLEQDSINTMIVVADPAATESTTASIRFSIDPATRTLVDEGLLRIAWFYPGELTETASAALAKLPENWISGALPEVEEYFRPRMIPAVYLLDPSGRVILKDRPYTMALQVFNVMAAGE